MNRKRRPLSPSAILLKLATLNAQAEAWHAQPAVGFHDRQAKAKALEAIEIEQAKLLGQLPSEDDPISLPF
jgi:hypothetical protein